MRLYKSTPKEKINRTTLSKLITLRSRHPTSIRNKDFLIVGNKEVYKEEVVIKILRLNYTQSGRVK